MRASLRTGLALAAVTFLVAAPVALAQNPTGTITGNVTDADGGALPGVTVSASSPNLQGARVAVTGSNGGYKLAFLPPGDYTVTYELEGFGTATREARVAAALTNTIDVTLTLAAVSEEIVVTGEAATISEGTTGASSYTLEEVESLPIQRDLDSAVLLAPGTHATGPGGGVTISGAMSFENLWTLNGVVINENVRGQELPLFIEDAIQETTTQVSGISAEFGRFAGGVINAITKSGGNEFSGSFRTSLTNDDWISDNAPEDLTPERVDDINRTYEATLGGYAWKDHLWFFAAGRDRELTGSESLFLTNIDVVQTDEQTRLEGKLTGTIADNHTLIGSYLEIDQSSTNNFFGTVLDRRSLTNREDPQEIKSFNYTGILTPNFFVEGQYSERDFAIAIGGGGTDRSLTGGTVLTSRTLGIRYHAPTFCGVCDQEIRNNENVLAKGSYFLNTESLGSHDFVFGADQFTDIRFSVNHQSASDFQVWDSDFTIRGEEVFPTFAPVGNDLGLADAWIGWWAVFNPEQAQPTDFETTSFYVNDRWQLNERWGLNLGARYDATDGTDGGGNQVLDDSKISPRLGATWDTQGDGDLVLNANVGTYVAGIANTRADSTSIGGSIGVFLSRYTGPAINVECLTGGPCLSSTEALDLLFDWYLANGGTTDINGDLSNLPNLISVQIPGATQVIPDTLRSPAADEYTLGASKRLGNRGLVRADVVYREFEDFYSNRIDQGTGQVDTPTGPADLTLVGNFGDDLLEREYRGLHLQGRYRLSDRLTLNANWTISELEGNINGETGGSGPVPESPRAYPEFADPSWNDPIGYLDADQRHKARLWAIWDVLDTDHHNLSLSVLQSYFSGSPFSLTGSVDTLSILGDLGYESPPTEVTYFFSDRGEFNFDDVTTTDLSLNYSFLWDAFGRQVEVYLQPEVLNVFNEDALIGFETRVHTALDNNAPGACPNSPDPDGFCVPFNPFTETPVEGVHWARFDDFGEPQADEDFQAPRVFRFSVGFRF
ncbi:MAG TPA: TonB-dependent receptor [Thermoanaerobaculia bacterium]|nr:TonB-dependent receptor [Thermoanaerobaculia bacterium]